MVGSGYLFPSDSGHEEGWMLISPLLFTLSGTVAGTLFSQVGRSLPGYGAQSGCSPVTSGRWSQLRPIPNSALVHSGPLHNVQALGHLRSSSTFAQKARGFATRYAGFSPGGQVSEVVDRLCQLVDKP